MSPTGSYVAVQTASQLVSPTGTNFISALYVGAIAGIALQCGDAHGLC